MTHRRIRGVLSELGKNSRQGGSNPRSTAYEAVALPLGHIGFTCPSTDYAQNTTWKRGAHTWMEDPSQKGANQGGD
jgi:hypothetical protein